MYTQSVFLYMVGMPGFGLGLLPLDRRTGGTTGVTRVVGDDGGNAFLRSIPIHEHPMMYC